MISCSPSDTENAVWPRPTKSDTVSREVADVFANLGAYYWLDCGCHSKAAHARERPRRHLDNYGPGSCWLLNRYILRTISGHVRDRPVRWIYYVGLGRDVAAFALSVLSSPASQSLSRTRPAERLPFLLPESTA